MEKRLIENTETKGYIHKIIKSSIVDGPGNRLAIFMQGCNFDCWYCHNPETIEFKSNCMEFTALELFKEVEKYFDFIDGITISGGEPLMQQDFIYNFLKLVKSHGDISCFIDTNASVEIDEKLFDVVDYFMVDVKVVDEKEHLNLTKCSNEMVLKNLVILKDFGKIYELRTVLYPGFDHKNTINFVNDFSNNSIEYKKIEYHTHGIRKEYIR